MRCGAETIWADPETKSMQSVAQAVVMWRQSLSVPLEICWQELGFSPQVIAQAKSVMGLPDRPAVPPAPTVPIPPGMGGAVILGNGNGAPATNGAGTP